MDFATQEVSNDMFGGLSAGADRLTNAGVSATPQMVAPGCYDLVDVVGWQPTPPTLEGRPSHAHNRLLSSFVLSTEERAQVATTHCERLSHAKAPVAYLLPIQGCNEWDREGADLHDAVGMATFCDTLTSKCPKSMNLHRLDCHINDADFTDKVLEIFDAWCADGTIKGR
jgi:uncharacterized protein (UPF0261 family)